MKKNLLILVLVLGLTGCGNKYYGQKTDILKEHKDIIFSVESGNKSNCVRVLLTLYEDNQYELFTDYAECKPGQNCTMKLSYTKSVKGEYNYDVIKIIEASTNANDKSYSMDNLPEYELTLGEKYIEKYDTLTFTVEKGQKNKYLDELLKQLDIDLNQCANPDYVE